MQACRYKNDSSQYCICKNDAHLHVSVEDDGRDIVDVEAAGFTPPYSEFLATGQTVSQIAGHCRAA